MPAWLAGTLPTHFIRRSYEEDLHSRSLEAAADYIDKHGWCQWALENYKGEVCAVGAMRRVLSSRETDVVRSVFSDRIGAWNIPDWNDRSGMTKRKVTSKFRSVATQIRREVCTTKN